MCGYATGFAATPTGNTAGLATAPTGISYAALINKFTNHEWDNGSWRKSAGVSVQATPQNLAAFRAGTLVNTADGQLHTVTSVKTVGTSLSVFMQGAPLDGTVIGYPNRLRAIGSVPVDSLPVDKNPGITPEASPASPAALINKFTNHEWDNGSWRKSAGVSVQATPANLASFEVGASVVLADGQVRTITEVRKVGSNLTVLMDGPVLDGTLVGYPNRLSVVDPTAQRPALPEASLPQEDVRERISLVGVNLSGAGFGSSVLPGKHGTNYIYPAESYYQKYAEQGLNLVRLPFLWERIQPQLDSALNATELARLVQSLDFADKHGVKVILDLHNYYRYYGKLIGSADVPIASFADVWRRLAIEVGDHPALSGYGLMNEPHNTNGLWPEAALAASQAIRQIEQEHWIYVAGDRYSSAWHWPKSNTRLIDDPWMRDPRNNLVYEAHMYLDRDTSGMYYDTTETFAPTLGIDRARPFVDWLKENGLRGYIGEFGVPAYAADAIDAMDNLLGYLRENCIPLTYWAAGPWWGDYVLALDVKSGEDRPQLPVLKKHAAAPSSCTSIGPLQ
ncbi:glycoside hydrolase family 5 protein [Stutzerimonas nitrititolerans]|uniref:Glycoside hydrolase family 5 protein n=1 Tax=Stutzerimonas nitrititolerans TaxID=2482751 RepID=A0AA41WIL8_9GAMM|nr:glycoside hydrolase family 5 protein [Stutzerimonas nitrititolerans]MCO7544143.1 glycoside hydrolase family 5 protein [Stutzerimonas nitrititolerans]